MHRLAPLLLPLAALLGGCYPFMAAAPRPTPEPPAAMAPDDPARQALMARTLERLAAEARPGWSFTWIEAERIEAVAGTLALGDDLAPVPPGAYWVITVKGLWEVAMPQGDTLAVREGYEARYAYAAATGRAAGRAFRTRGLARTVPRVPTAE